MGFLSFLKGMKIEDNSPVNITFRTSRTNGFLGLLFISAGLLLSTQLYWYYAFFRSFQVLLVLSVVVCAILTCIGILIATYRKCVIICKPQSRIEYMESSFLGYRRATFHFKEILNVEVCRISEGLCSSRCLFWTVKIYLQRYKEFETVRLFEGIDRPRAEEAARYLEGIVKTPIMKTTPQIAPSGLLTRMGVQL